MTFYCLQHAPGEGPETIGHWIHQRGHTLQIIHLYLGERLPELTPSDVLLIMGGAMNLYQFRDHPWLRDEFAQVEKIVAAGNKILGICLGAQILADILGARVTQNRQQEIGWFSVHFTPEARAIFPCLPEEQSLLHWHGDTFSLPSGTVRIGFSEACPEQGFLYQKQMLALQFHLESCGCAAPADLSASARADLVPGPYVQDEGTLIQLSQLHREQARLLVTDWLDAFF